MYSKFILKNTNFTIKNTKNNNITNKKDNNMVNLNKKNKDIKNNKEMRETKDIKKKFQEAKENKELKEFLDILNESKSTIKEDIKITKISLPNKSESDLFFEILLWMYTKDKTKLKKFTKNFEILLNLLSLGIYLKMKKEYKMGQGIVHNTTMD